MERDQTIARAALMRAAVIGLLNEKPVLVPAGEIIQTLSEKAKQLGYTNPESIYSVLSTMAKNNLIHRESDGTKSLYGSFRKAEEWQPPAAPPQRQGRVSRNLQAADLKVDIVKGTGKVRLSISGMVIEIGVVDQ